jgi:hypothetical protein
MFIVPMPSYTRYNILQVKSVKNVYTIYTGPINRLPLHRRGMERMENTPIAQQRMSYCCHARLANRCLPHVA